MGYKITSFQNASDWDDELPTITIKITHPDWDNIYQRWVSGKKPTDSPEWNKGMVFACTSFIATATRQSID